MPSENTRRIAKNSLMLYIRMLLTMGISLYTSRVVLNTLGVEDFGIYSVVGGVIVLFSFLNASMGTATSRFLLKTLLGYPVLDPEFVKGPLIISIGNNQIRQKIAGKLDIEYGEAVHPLAVISEYTTISAGTVVMQGVIVQSGVEIGKHGIINTGSSVDHDCMIGDYVHISPHSTLCGNVTVGDGSWVGAGTVVIPGVKIGK